MTRFAFALPLAVIAVLLLGCTTSAPHESAPPSRAPMPEVSAQGPDLAPRSVTAAEVEQMRQMSVSSAVNILTLHGYDVTVVDRAGAELAQDRWDFDAVIDVHLDAVDATVVIG